MATGCIHIGTMIGKLNGVIPATTPSGARKENTSTPPEAWSEYSPLSRVGSPQANSTTSSPRCTSPRASDSTLPCSAEITSASSSTRAFTSSRKANITFVRALSEDCDQLANAARATPTACSTSAADASSTSADCSPVAGSYTAAVRLELPVAGRPPIQWEIVFMGPPGQVGRTLPGRGRTRARDEGPVPRGSHGAVATPRRWDDPGMDDIAAPEGSRLRVFLLDDHEVVRQGLRALIDSEPDLEVVGEAGTAAEALARVPAVRPDVAVLDVRLPDGDGIAVCRELRSTQPDLACLMLTSFGDDEALASAVLAGAAGYILKQIRGTDLVGAVRTVGSGGSLLDASATSRLLQRLRGEAARRDPLDALTDQERRVLQLIGEGLTNREIGARMFLAEKTVKNYVSSLLSKLGLVRRTQAAVLVTELRAVGGD